MFRVTSSHNCVSILVCGNDSAIGCGDSTASGGSKMTFAGLPIGCIMAAPVGLSIVGAGVGDAAAVTTTV